VILAAVLRASCATSWLPMNPEPPITSMFLYVMAVIAFFASGPRRRTIV
jgi:hypothetical protein